MTSSFHKVRSDLTCLGLMISKVVYGWGVVDLGSGFARPVQRQSFVGLGFEEPSGKCSDAFDRGFRVSELQTQRFLLRRGGSLLNVSTYALTKLCH